MTIYLKGSRLDHVDLGMLESINVGCRQNKLACFTDEW